MTFIDFMVWVNKIENQEFSTYDEEFVVKLFDNKEIYMLSDTQNLIIKKIKDVREYEIMNEVQFLEPSITPRIIYYHNNYILMERIDGITVADMYGEDASIVPKKIWNQIRHIVRRLNSELGIWYLDITPYNFMLDDNGNVYVIDFEHCSTESKSLYMTDFIHYEVNEWNPDFR